jgi:hypothetical protein
MDQSGLRSALNAAWRGTVRDHANLGALRQLHGLFVKHGRLDSDLTSEEWTSVDNAATDSLGAFSAYAGLLHGTDEVYPLLHEALTEWHSRIRNSCGIPVVMLEPEMHGNNAAGIVLELTVSALRGTGKSTLNNALGTDGGSTAEQVRRAGSLARKFIAERLMQKARSFDMHYSIPGTEAMLEGGSIGLAMAVGSVAAASQAVNGQTRWFLQPGTAIIGSLDENGKVQEARWNVIERKLRLCFFAQMERVVIPAGHNEPALRLVHSMQDEFPLRQMSLSAAGSLTECLDNPGIVQQIHRTRAKRIGEYARNHSTALLVLALSAVIVCAGWFAWKAWYDYPDLEHALGLKIGTNAIVYNPKDTLEWCFRDGADVKEPRVSFGDLDVGDGYSRNFWLWNMTPRSMDVVLAIEGPDASQWYINWRNGLQVLPSAAALRMSVMFAPTCARQNMNASLVVREPSGKELYRLLLTGAAGPPMPGGYALSLDGLDDMMYLGRNATEFCQSEATVEMWVKPRGGRGAVIYNGTDLPDEPAFFNLHIGYSDVLFVHVGNAELMLPLPASMLENNWTHIAIAYSVPKGAIDVFINGGLSRSVKSEFLIEGGGYPHVTIGCMNDLKKRSDFLNGELEDVRLWKGMRTVEQVRKDMNQNIPFDDRSCLGNWNFNNDCEVTAFNANGRAHNADLTGRPSLVRSTAPVHPFRKPDCEIVSCDGHTGIKLEPFRFMACYRNLLQGLSATTISLVVRLDTASATWFSLTNLDEQISIVSTRKEVELQVKDEPNIISKAALTCSPGWHRLTLTLDSAAVGTLYLDGVFVEKIQYRSRWKDLSHRYEGFQLGFFDDKYNVYGPKIITQSRKWLSSPRTYESLQIWNRILGPNEIAALFVYTPHQGLAASWSFNAPPDDCNNYIDSVGGLLMHVERVVAWDGKRK